MHYKIEISLGRTFKYEVYQLTKSFIFSSWKYLDAFETEGKARDAIKLANGFPKYIEI